MNCIYVLQESNIGAKVYLKNKTFATTNNTMVLSNIHNNMINAQFK